MAAKIPSSYKDNTAYAKGATVNYNGVEFEATSAIANTNETNPIDDNGANWKATRVIRVQDAYSLYYDVMFTLNDDNLTRNIWGYITEACHEVNKVLRTVAQVETRTVTLDADGKADVTELGFLDIDHVKIEGDAGFTYSTQENGKIEILMANNKAEYETLKQRYRSSGFYTGAREFHNPVFWLDGTYMWIAPIYSAGTEVEVTYKLAESILGTTELVVNDDYEALNDSDQTLEEWIADGNSADTFVQAETLITTNLWTDQCPYLLKFAALRAASQFLDNREKAAYWNEAYKQNLEETIDYLESFEAEQPHTIQLYSRYSY